jgi:hypothetical protein
MQPSASKACAFAFVALVSSMFGTTSLAETYYPASAVPLLAESDVGTPTLASMSGGDEDMVADNEKPAESICCEPCCVPCCVPCCITCCDNPCASWTVSAGWLYMTRSDPDDAVLFFNPAVENEVVNASDFDFGWQSGFEVGITKHRLFCDTDLELRLWAIDGWTARAGTSLSGPTTGIGTNPPLQAMGARDVASSYASRIGSLELNLRRRSHIVPRWKWIAGFRMLELDEHLDSLFTDPNQNLGNFEYRVATRNRLYGFQLGGELDLISSSCWCVRGFAKGGIYGNESNNSSAFDCLHAPECNFQAGQNKSQTSFIGETGISAKYCVCENWALRADYRAMWVSGVALASEQINATSYLDSSGVSTSGDVFYHGGFLGLEYTY